MVILRVKSPIPFIRSGRLSRAHQRIFIKILHAEVASGCKASFWAERIYSCVQFTLSQVLVHCISSETWSIRWFDRIYAFCPALVQPELEVQSPSAFQSPAKTCLALMTALSTECRRRSKLQEASFVETKMKMEILQHVDLPKVSLLPLASDPNGILIRDGHKGS